ncbi:MAG: 5-formyltetrahydrofolate cyclo-ligase [Candidatus Anstonellaceae archaeon]
MDIENQKSLLRKRFLELRKNFFNKFSVEDEEKLISNLFLVEEFSNASVILSYMSKDGEVPTKNLNLKILNSKKILCLPKTDTKNKELIIKKILSYEELENGPFGVLEPKESCQTIVKIDVAIIPGVVFSKDGYRLGYGFGYYDRFLQKNPCFKIGLCFSSQLIDKLPYEGHDVKMDCLVSESFVLRIKK